MRKLLAVLLAATMAAVASAAAPAAPPAANCSKYADGVFLPDTDHDYVTLLLEGCDISAPTTDFATYHGAAVYFHHFEGAVVIRDTTIRCTAYGAWCINGGWMGPNTRLVLENVTLVLPDGSTGLRIAGVSHSVFPERIHIVLDNLHVDLAPKATASLAEVHSILFGSEFLFLINNTNLNEDYAAALGGVRFSDITFGANARVTVANSVLSVRATNEMGGGTSAVLAFEQSALGTGNAVTVERSTLGVLCDGSVRTAVNCGVLALNQTSLQPASRLSVVDSVINATASSDGPAPTLRQISGVWLHQLSFADGSHFAMARTKALINSATVTTRVLTFDSVTLNDVRFDLTDCHFFVTARKVAAPVASLIQEPMEHRLAAAMTRADEASVSNDKGRAAVVDALSTSSASLIYWGAIQFGIDSPSVHLTVTRCRLVSEGRTPSGFFWILWQRTVCPNDKCPMVHVAFVDSDIGVVGHQSAYAVSTFVSESRRMFWTATSFSMLRSKVQFWAPTSESQGLFLLPSQIYNTSLYYLRDVTLFSPFTAADVMKIVDPRHVSASARVEVCNVAWASGGWWTGVPDAFTNRSVSKRCTSTVSQTLRSTATETAVATATASLEVTRTLRDPTLIDASAHAGQDILLVGPYLDGLIIVGADAAATLTFRDVTIGGAGLRINGQGHDNGVAFSARAGSGNSTSIVMDNVTAALSAEYTADLSAWTVMSDTAGMCGTASSTTTPGSLVTAALTLCGFGGSVTVTRSSFSIDGARLPAFTDRDTVDGDTTATNSFTVAAVAVLPVNGGSDKDQGVRLEDSVIDVVVGGDTIGSTAAITGLLFRSPTGTAHSLSLNKVRSTVAVTSMGAPSSVVHHSAIDVTVGTRTNVTYRPTLSLTNVVGRLDFHGCLPLVSTAAKGGIFRLQGINAVGSRSSVTVAGSDFSAVQHCGLARPSEKRLTTSGCGFGVENSSIAFRGSCRGCSMVGSSHGLSLALWDSTSTWSGFFGFSVAAAGGTSGAVVFAAVPTALSASVFTLKSATLAVSVPSDRNESAAVWLPSRMAGDSRVVIDTVRVVETATADVCGTVSPLDSFRVNPADFALPVPGAPPAHLARNSTAALDLFRQRALPAPAEVSNATAICLLHMCSLVGSSVPQGVAATASALPLSIAHIDGTMNATLCPGGGPSAATCPTPPGPPFAGWALLVAATVLIIIGIAAYTLYPKVRQWWEDRKAAWLQDSDSEVHVSSDIGDLQEPLVRRSQGFVAAPDCSVQGVINRCRRALPTDAGARPATTSTQPPSDTDWAQYFRVTKAHVDAALATPRRRQTLAGHYSLEGAPWAIKITCRLEAASLRSLRLTAPTVLMPASTFHAYGAIIIVSRMLTPITKCLQADNTPFDPSTGVVAVEEEDFSQSSPSRARLMPDAEPIHVTPGQALHDIHSALISLHTQGVCHGAVSPGNVLLDASTRRVLLCDLEFATKPGARTVPARSGPAFAVPPEHRTSAETIETSTLDRKRADVYMFAATVLQLLAGTGPEACCRFFARTLRVPHVVEWLALSLSPVPQLRPPLDDDLTIAIIDSLAQEPEPRDLLDFAQAASEEFAHACSALRQEHRDPEALRGEIAKGALAYAQHLLYQHQGEMHAAKERPGGAQDVDHRAGAAMRNLALGYVMHAAGSSQDSARLEFARALRSALLDSEVLPAHDHLGHLHHASTPASYEDLTRSCPGTTPEFSPTVSPPPAGAGECSVAVTPEGKARRRRSLRQVSFTAVTAGAKDRAAVAASALLFLRSTAGRSSAAVRVLLPHLARCAAVRTWADTLSLGPMVSGGVAVAAPLCWSLTPHCASAAADLKDFAWAYSVAHGVVEGCMPRLLEVLATTGDVLETVDLQGLFPLRDADVALLDQSDSAGHCTAGTARRRRRKKHRAITREDRQDVVAAVCAGLRDWFDSEVRCEPQYHPMCPAASDPSSYDLRLDAAMADEDLRASFAAAVRCGLAQGLEPFATPGQLDGVLCGVLEDGEADGEPRPVVSCVEFVSGADAVRPSVDGWVRGAGAPRLVVIRYAAEAAAFLDNPFKGAADMDSEAAAALASRRSVSLAAHGVGSGVGLAPAASQCVVPPLSLGDGRLHSPHRAAEDTEDDAAHGGKVGEMRSDLSCHFNLSMARSGDWGSPRILESDGSSSEGSGSDEPDPAPVETRPRARGFFKAPSFRPSVTPPRASTPPPDPTAGPRFRAFVLGAVSADDGTVVLRPADGWTFGGAGAAVSDLIPAMAPDADLCFSDHRIVVPRDVLMAHLPADVLTVQMLSH